MKTNELDSGKYDALIAQAYFILTQENNQKLTTNPSFLRGNRNHFWKALDSHFFFQRNIKNKRKFKISEFVESLVSENNIYLANLSSRFQIQNKKDFIFSQNHKKKSKYFSNLIILYFALFAMIFTLNFRNVFFSK